MTERLAKIPLSLVMLILAAVMATSLFFAAYSYLGISANLENQQDEKARYLLAAAGDPMRSNARFDFNDGFADRTSIVNWESNFNQNIDSASAETSVKFYSPRSEYHSVSLKPDEFLKSAYSKISTGGKDFISEQFLKNQKEFTRFVVPQYSKGDCIDCSNNELIGLRQIIFTLEYSNLDNSRWQFYAGLASLCALLLIVVLIVPISRFRDLEKTGLLKQIRQLELAANTDVLTGLPNRRFFEGELDKQLSEYNEQDQDFGLFILDIDHFKQVNDKFGHDAGDIVLQKIAGRISRATLKNEIVCRIGGEEFAILAPYNKRESVASIGERFRSVVAEMYIDVGQAVLRPSISIGVATNIGRGRFSEDLLKTADEKLYLAKHNGRNQVAA